MTRLAAKALMRIGIAMIILCVLCRFIATTSASVMGDNLAILASIALTIVAGLYLRFGGHDERDRPREAQPGGSAEDFSTAAKRTGTRMAPGTAFDSAKTKGEHNSAR